MRVVSAEEAKKIVAKRRLADQRKAERRAKEREEQAKLDRALDADVVIREGDNWGSAPGRQS